MGQFGDEMVQLYKQMRTQKKNLKNMTTNLKQDRNQKRQSVMNNLQTLQKERIERNKGLTKELKESRRSIGKSVANLKKNTVKEQNNFRKQLSLRSQQERSDRQAYLSGLQNNVNKVLSEFKGQHLKEAEKSRKDRLDLRRTHAKKMKKLRDDCIKRKNVVMEMCQATSQKRIENIKTLNDVAIKERSDRAKYISSLRKEVNTLLKDGQKVRNDFSSDLLRARKAALTDAITEENTE